MAILSPTTRLMSVDFPTLGLPMMPMKPDLNTDVSFVYSTRGATHTTPGVFLQSDLK
jgi:hypothetical protein